MKILITGSNGFIGKNLIHTLKNTKPFDNSIIYEFDVDKENSLLDDYTKDCDFVFHLAGINRPQNDNEFMKGNYDFTSSLLKKLKNNNNKSPILFTSSMQAQLSNPYGISKKAGEDVLFNYSKETGVKVYIYRLQNVFGKWCRPNYNSAVATFCNNIANNLPIQINDPETMLNLVYIDDVIDEFINALQGKANIKDGYCSVNKTYEIKLGEISELIYSFKNTRENLYIPNMDSELTKKLYATYLSYLPKDGFSYPLKMNTDERGSFTEFIKTTDRGQVSVNIIKSGVVKGNHWHNTKNEKFLVVSGKGVIRFRNINDNEIIEYFVSSEKLEVVDIPTGYTHSIENLGQTDMVTIMWANEVLNPEKTDTYFLEV